MTKDKLLQKKCILGVNTAVKSVHLLDQDQILYSCGNNVLIWNKHTKNQIFLYQCGNGEEICFIELCSSKKQIAITIRSVDGGPQVLLYDAIACKRKKVIKPDIDDGSDVIGLSFSKDGKHCLVLRDKPNYLLTLWNIEKVAKASASIRLATPSGKRIKHATIKPSMEGKETTVCASGIGIIRFFKVIDGIFRPVTVNLRREQQNYVAQSWLSDKLILLATDSNELIVMCNFVAKVVVPIDGWNQSITSMIPFSQGVVVGGSKGSIRVYTCTEENNHTPSLAKDLRVDDTNDSEEILAIDKVTTEEMCACLTSTGRICSLPLSDNDTPVGENLVPWFHSAGPDGKCRITCMEVSNLKPIIATGGSDKTLRIWNYETKSFELIRKFPTHIISISLHPSSLKILVCCENQVSLSYVHYEGLSIVWQREIKTNGCSRFSNGGQYFALVCGPFIQVYDTYKLHPICTLRGHSSPIVAIAWRQDDQDLATIGSDNVTCIWSVSNGKRKLRHVNETSSYIGGCCDDELDFAIINTNDKVGMFNISTSSFERDIGLPSNVIVQSCIGGTKTTIMGTFTDDSLQGDIWFTHLDSTSNVASRLHQKKLHSQQISFAKLSNALLFTSSDDGSLCICDVCENSIVGCNALKKCDRPSLVFQDLLVPENDLEDKENRIKDLRLEIEETKRKHHDELDYLLRNQNEKVSKIKRQIHEASTVLLQKKHEKETAAMELKEKLQRQYDSEVERFSFETEKLQTEKHEEREAEKNRIDQYVNTQREKVESWKSERAVMIEQYNREKEGLSNQFEEKIQHEIAAQKKLMDEKNDLMAKHTKFIEMLEEDADMEMTSETKSFESAAIQERKTAVLLREENDITKKKYDALMKDFDEHKETIISLKEKQQELSSSIACMQQLKLDKERALKKLDEDIIRLDVAINNATEETHKMERSKLTQSRIVNELKNKLKPRHDELQIIHERKNEIDAELKKSRQHNDNLRVEVENIDRKLISTKKELASKILQVEMKRDEVFELEKKLQDLSNHSQDFNSLKKQLTKMSHEYASPKTKGTNNRDTNDKNRLSLKERKSDVLKKKIKGKQDILKRNRNLHQTRMRKLERDQIILEEQLQEVQHQSHCIARRQGEILK